MLVLKLPSTAAWGTSRAANALRAGLGWGAFGGAYRREGDLNWNAQFDPVGRAKSALTSGAFGAAAQSVLGKASEWLAAQRGRPVGLSQILPPEARNGQLKPLLPAKPEPKAVTLADLPACPPNWDREAQMKNIPPEFL